MCDFFLLENRKYVVQQQPGDRYQSPQLPEIEIDLAAFWAEIENRIALRAQEVFRLLSAA